MLASESVCSIIGLDPALLCADSYQDFVPSILSPYTCTTYSQELFSKINVINSSVEHGVGVQAIYLLSVANFANLLFAQTEIDYADFTVFANWDMTGHDLIGKTATTPSFTKSYRYFYSEKYGLTKPNELGADGDNRPDELRIASLNHPGVGGWGAKLLGEYKILPPDLAEKMSDAAFWHHETGTNLPDCISYPRAKDMVERPFHKKRKTPPHLAARVFGILADRLRGMNAEPRSYRKGPVPMELQQMQLDIILNDILMNDLNHDIQIHKPLAPHLLRKLIKQALFGAVNQLGAVNEDARIEHPCLPAPNMRLQVPFHAHEIPEVVWEKKNAPLTNMANNLERRFYDNKKEFEDKLRGLKLPN